MLPKVSARKSSLLEIKRSVMEGLIAADGFYLGLLEVAQTDKERVEAAGCDALWTSLDLAIKAIAAKTEGPDGEWAVDMAKAKFVWLWA